MPDDFSASGQGSLGALYSALASTPHIVFSFDVSTGVCRFLSPRFRELTGFSSTPPGLAEFLGCFHDEDRSKVESGAGGDVRLRDARGQWRWFDLSSAHGAEGAVNGVLADVHDRKTEEERRKISEETLRSVFDAAPFPITVTTPQGEVLYVNDRVYDFYGLDRSVDVVEQMSTTDFYVDPESRREIVSRLISSGEAHDVAIEMRRKDGRTVWTSFSARLTKFAGKTAIVSAQFDIDERKRAEKRLQDSEEKFSKVFINAPLLMGIAEVETGRIVDVNREFERVLGYSVEDLKGRTYAESGIVDPGKREKVFSSLMTKGSIKGLEMDVTAKDGSLLNISYNGELINIDGRTMILSIVEDITERRRRAESEFRAQRIESLGVLAGGIAHDFNNILTGILGNLSLARALGGVQPEIDARLEECEKASRRAGELSHQLLTFSKGGAPRKTVVRLGKLIEETASFALRGSNVSAVIDRVEELCAVEADSGQIAQVFSNLFINAAQAMPMGGEVRVTASNLDLHEGNEYGLGAGQYVAVAIVDRGCGIPREALDRIFDPYFTTKPSGTGLGLSTVFSILKRHDGGIFVRSNPGVGSEFTAFIPALRCDLPRDEVDRSPFSPNPGLRVLVMDDEQIIRELSEKMLTHLGYEATTASDGAEAVVYAKRAAENGTPFHAAILDLTVPGRMGGREAASLITDSSPSTKILVSSGYSNDPVMSNPKAYGFSGIIPKPYALPALAAELHRLLGDGAVDR